MTRMRIGLILVAMVQAMPSPYAAAQQQVTVSTPLVTVRDRFYEHINLGWGYHRTGPRGSWFIGWGGPMSVLPPFGGYNPAADFRFGFDRRGNGSGFQFNLAASQGSSRSITMDAPSVTMMNGARGQIFSGSLRPFVTGLVPVVGGYPVVVPYAPNQNYFSSPAPPVLVSPLAERLERLRHESVLEKNSEETADELVLAGAADDPVVAARASTSSSATRGDISVAEIRRLNARQDEIERQKLADLIADAEEAERTGNLGAARTFYQQAAARAAGEQRQALLKSVERLKPRR